MDTTRFKEVVRTFLDSTDQFDTDRGDLALQVGTEVITGKLSVRSGALYVKEDTSEIRAEDWIVNRMAMIPLLADRILAAVPENPTFVVPKGDFLDEISRSPDDRSVEISNATATVCEFLSRKLGGTCSVLYLTSDAGEGKTTVINQIARKQAEKYKARESDWLLVPISLGGKPFLRFDDVVVASLVNQLRFQRLYFDAFVHLVRMGVIVPALDGFEEIFVESSEGEAITSLSTLITQLRGEGALLIAARKAYFEFRSLQSQARLLDGLPDVDVAFGRVALRRWAKPEFVEYAELSGINDATGLYDDVARILPERHPLITRPVLVKRLVELAGAGDRAFIEQLRSTANYYFAWLVDRLLEREATEKWINKHGDPPRPLLSVKEHHELLGYIAEEMWISKTGALNGEMMDSLAEIFCEAKDYSPVVSRQVKERLKQHALIVSTGVARREFAFDHDDFREFFLGERLGDYLLTMSHSDIRKMFRMDTLPALSIEAANERISTQTRDTGPLIEQVLRVGLSESSSTFVRENAGAVIAPLLACAHSEPLRIDGLVFPPDSLKGRTMSRIDFVNCYFRPTSLEHTNLVSCKFDDCEFEHLGLVNNALHVEKCELLTTKIDSLSVTHEDVTSDYYDPEEISILLERHGFSLPAEQLTLVTETVEADQDLRIAEKALQTFHRSTLVPEGTFRLRLSVNANHFVDHLLPKLTRAGILEEVRVGGADKYKLGVSLLRIAGALARCRGSFDSFVRIAGKNLPR